MAFLSWDFRIAEQKWHFLKWCKMNLKYGWLQQVWWINLIWHEACLLCQRLAQSELRSGCTLAFCLGKSFKRIFPCITKMDHSYSTKRCGYLLQCLVGKAFIPSVYAHRGILEGELFNNSKLECQAIQHCGSIFAVEKVSGYAAWIERKPLDAEILAATVAS